MTRAAVANRAEAPTVAITASSRPPDSWLELLDGCDQVDFMQEELWTRALCTHLRDAEARWVVVHAQGRPVAGQVLMHVRRRWLHSLASHQLGHPCAPLVVEDISPELRHLALETLIRTVAEMARSPRCLGAHWTLDADWDRRLAAPLTASGFQRSPVETALFPLVGGIDYVESKVFKANRRNERNHGYKLGCTTEISTDPEDLQAIYRLYEAASTRWGTTPLPQGLLLELLADGVGKVFLIVVRCEDSVVGGHLCWQDGDTVVAWVGASDPDHTDKYVPTLIVWQELLESCARGALWLDLGGDGGQAGVRRFKKLLGADFVERGCWETASPAMQLLKSVRSRLRRGSSR